MWTVQGGGTEPLCAAAGLRRWVAMRIAAEQAGTALPFVLLDATTGRAFGSTSLFDIDGAHRRMELGHTWVGASHRRTAANTEAKRLVLGHAFDTLGGGPRAAEVR